MLYYKVVRLIFGLFSFNLLGGCYEDQNEHVVSGAAKYWPLVTDMSAIEKWWGGSDNYVGEFLVEYSGKEYSIYVYNQKCKDYNTKKDFDGPEIVKKLDKWSNNRKGVIVVEGTKDK